MKDKFNNESGAALVLVLLSIFLIMIFGAVLASQINSSGMQVKNSQHNVQAEALAVMGQEFFIESVKASKISDNPLNFIESQWENSFERTVDTEKQYKVELLGTDTKESDETVLTYRSKGVSFGIEEIITGEISLNSSSDVKDDWRQEIIDQLPNDTSVFNNVICDDKNPGNGNKNDCNINSGGDVYLEGRFYSNGGKDRSVVGGDFWVDGSINLIGGSSINVNGFAYFDQTSLYMNGNTAVSINGNAYFDLNYVDIKNNDRITVKGNALFNSPESLTEYHDVFCISGKTNLKDSEGNTIGGQSCP